MPWFRTIYSPIRGPNSNVRDFAANPGSLANQRRWQDKGISDADATAGDFGELCCHDGCCREGEFGALVHDDVANTKYWNRCFVSDGVVYYDILFVCPPNSNDFEDDVAAFFEPCVNLLIF